MGEVRTASELLRALKSEVNSPVQFVFSVISKTGYQVATEDENVAKVFYLPIDLPFIVNKFMRRLNLDLVIGTKEAQIAVCGDIRCIGIKSSGKILMQKMLP